MGFAWTMARFTTGDFILPTGNRRQRSMRGVRISFELVFVSVLARVRAHVVVRSRLVVNSCFHNCLRASRRPYRRGRRDYLADVTAARATA